MAYLTAFLTGARRTLAARGDLSTQVGMMLLVILALSSVWHAAAVAHGGHVGAYTFGELVWYITFAEACTVPVPARVIEDIGEEIGSGEIAVAMLRPASVVGIRMAIDTGAALARQWCCLLAGGAFAWLLAGPPSAGAATVQAVGVAFLALLLSIALQHALGGIAFWLNDARSTWFLFQKLILIGGGVLIPLNLLPHAVASIFIPLPFAAIAYVPGSFAAGHGSWGLVIGQLCWLIVGFGTAFLVFARGERRLEVLGG